MRPETSVVILRSRSNWPMTAICAGTLCVTFQAGIANANHACDLMTVSELETVLGSPVAMKGAAPMASGKTEICTGQTPTAAVTLRLATDLNPDRDRSGSKEKAGLELFKNMGARVEVKRFGPIICSTIEHMQTGFNSTCTVVKDTAVAGIEVTAKSRADMVSIEKLHPLAEKMATRF
jgi:hypothetical protein